MVLAVLSAADYFRSFSKQLGLDRPAEQRSR
jgi:hypothetical protein